MSNDYRDPLGAAHARIAELETKVRILEEEAQPKPFADGRFPELEAKVEGFKKAADAEANAKRRTLVSFISIIFPILGMTFSFLHMPVVATICSGFFMTFLVYNFVLIRHLNVAKRGLVEAHAKLADARRIAELESKLAATNVRVAAPLEPELEDEASTAPAARAAR